MTAFVSDKQIIERMLIPAMLNSLILLMKQRAAAADGSDLPELDRASHLLEDALEEPIRELAPGKVSKLIRRAKRITALALAQNFELSIGLQYLIVARWTMDLAERGVIVIGAESAFSRAWDLIAALMAPVVEDLEAEEATATAAARMLSNRLAQHGYFVEGALR
ncbi:MAG: hypothetical protein GC191_18485 [Azospirillum sp.]|nr:hypothetical protein [Azospirillum sp.]